MTHPFFLSDHLRDARLDLQIIRDGGGWEGRGYWQGHLTLGSCLGGGGGRGGERGVEVVGGRGGDQLQGAARRHPHLLGAAALDGESAALLGGAVGPAGCGEDASVLGGLLMGRLGGEIMLVVHIGQTSDLQTLRHLQQRGDVLLAHVDLPLVHELHHCLQLEPPDILQDDDRVLAGVLGEHILEVRAAGGQHHLMSFQRVAVASQSHIHERLTLQELVKHVGEVALVVVPPETELLGGAAAALTSPGAQMSGGQVTARFTILHFLNVFFALLKSQLYI